MDLPNRPCLLAFCRRAPRFEEAFRAELRDQLQAGVHPLSVHDHGAGAALSHVASLLRARETEVLPQRIQQDEPRFGLQSAWLTVHDQRYLEKRRRS